jgi:hypothetical protein
MYASSLSNNLTRSRVYWQPVSSRLVGSACPYISRRWLHEDIHGSQTRPLRVLFCGSDEFSCASLRALHEEKQSNISIASIDVLCRPGKLSGRGMKTVKEGGSLRGQISAFKHS